MIPPWLSLTFIWIGILGTLGFMKSGASFAGPSYVMLAISTMWVTYLLGGDK